MRLSGGEAAQVAFGAVALAAPVSVEDFAYYLVATDDRIAAYARFVQGAQPVPAGSYRLVREGSGVFYELEVAGGETTTIAAAALRVTAIGGGNPGYYVVSADAAQPVLRAAAGELAQLLLPLPEPYALVSSASPDLASTSGTGFTPLAGRVASFWMRGDGTFLPAEADGELAVDFATRRSGYLAAGEMLVVHIEIPEPARLTVRGLSGAALNRPGPEISIVAAVPPAVSAELAVPADADQGGLFQVEAEAQLTSGLMLKGRSGVRPVAPPLTASVAAVTVQATTATTVSLTWQSADDPRVIGYNVYRVPHGTLPINGEMPVRAASFVDIGLSSGRSYDYDVCAVDDRGIEGQCSPPLRVDTATTH